MAKKQIIYAVNSGTYSDYRIVALFSAKKLADEYMAAIPDGYYNDVEEYVLNPNTADLVRRGYSWWIVHMLKNGDTESVFRLSYFPRQENFLVWRRTQAPAYIGKNVPDCLSATVFSKTEKQAVKIANEHRAQMIASGEWD